MSLLSSVMAQIIRAVAPPVGGEYHELVLDAAPLGYWRMDETSGTTLVDATTGNDGVISGTYTLDIAPTAEVTGRAIKFTNAGVVPASIGTLPTGGAGGWCAEFLVKLFTADSPANAYMLLRQNSGDIVFNFGGTNRIGIFKNTGAGGAVATTALGPTVPRDDQWHHIVIGWNPTNSRYEAYLDGALDSFYVQTAPSLNAAVFRIGQAGPSSASFVGGLDEFAVYDRFLTPTEIADHANRAGVVAALWTPAEITTALWLDADDASTFTLAGSDIDEWRDKSGNARHATPATATKPTRTATGISSMGSVVFGSVADPLLTTAFAPPAAADGLMVFAVYVRTGIPVNYSDPFCHGVTNAQLSLLLGSSALSAAAGRGMSYWRNGAAAPTTATSPNDVVVTDTPMLWSGAMSNAGIDQWKNGALLAGSVGAATRNFGGSAAMTIGASPTASYNEHRFQGQLGELLFVPADVTTATRQRIEGYLAWKWGLEASLPVGHPYELAAPTVTYEVFLASGTFNVPAGVSSVDVLLVAGGGGGGGFASFDNGGGGGGAGGVRSVAAVTVTPSGTVAVTVGAAGAAGSSGQGGDGGASSFGAESVTAGGGGQGYTGSVYQPVGAGRNGGSGGGCGGAASGAQVGGTGVSGEGNAGGALDGGGAQRPGSGGGGKGAVGGAVTANDAGAGGAGITLDSIGWGDAAGAPAAVGGGGGGGRNGGTAGAGGAGGGGAGASSGAGNPGTANTGGGGGGSGAGSALGGAGGSGLVVVRYN